MFQEENKRRAVLVNQTISVLFFLSGVKNRKTANPNSPTTRTPHNKTFSLSAEPPRDCVSCPLKSPPAHRTVAWAPWPTLAVADPQSVYWLIMVIFHGSKKTLLLHFINQVRLVIKNEGRN